MGNARAAVPESIVPENAGPSFMKFSLELSRNREVSPLAKQLYCRLALFAGVNGVCTPSHETLADEIAVSVRYVAKLLRELRGCGLIEWHRRRTSCSYAVNPVSAFVSPDLYTCADQVLHTCTDHDRNTCADKKMFLKRGSVKDVDLDCPLPKAKRADALPAQHPRIKNTLARYRSGGSTPKPEHFPSDSMVAEIVHAAGDCGEDWIVGKLYFLHNELGLRWGAQNGPRAWRWFITVLAERAEREDALYRGRAPENIWECDGTRQVH